MGFRCQAGGSGSARGPRPAVYRGGSTRRRVPAHRRYASSQTSPADPPESADPGATRHDRSPRRHRQVSRPTRSPNPPRESIGRAPPIDATTLDRFANGKSRRRRRAGPAAIAAEARTTECRRSAISRRSSRPGVDVSWIPTRPGMRGAPQQFHGWHACGGVGTGPTTFLPIGRAPTARSPRGKRRFPISRSRGGAPSGSPASASERTLRDVGGRSRT